MMGRSGRCVPERGRVLTECHRRSPLHVAGRQPTAAGRGIACPAGDRPNLGASNSLRGPCLLSHHATLWQWHPVCFSIAPSSSGRSARGSPRPLGLPRDGSRPQDTTVHLRRSGTPIGAWSQVPDCVSPSAVTSGHDVRRIADARPTIARKRNRSPGSPLLKGQTKGSGTFFGLDVSRTAIAKRPKNEPDPTPVSGYEKTPPTLSI